MSDVEILRQRLAETDPSARRSAIDDVIEDFVEELAPEVVLLTTDPEAEVRAAACLATGLLLALRGEEADPIVHGALRALSTAVLDEELDVRLAAIEGLGQLAGIAAIPTLVGVLGRSGRVELEVAADAVREIADLGRSPLALLTELLDDEGARLGAVRALGALGPRAAPALPGLLRAMDQPGCRVPVLDALAAFGRAAAPALPELTRLVHRSAEPERQLVVVLVALGGLAAEVLSGVIARGNQAVRRTVLEEMHGNPDPELLGVVGATLYDEAADLRAYAVRVLSSWGELGRPAANDLSGLLSDPDASVRAEAADALALLGVFPAIDE